MRAPLLPERRKTPRAVIADTDLSVLGLPVAVRLLDISLMGVLFESTRAVDIGTRATLRFNFGGAPFSTDVKVERMSSRHSRSGSETFSIGATFVGLSRQDQHLIERFAHQ